jgi:hypothetical protein
MITSLVATVEESRTTWLLLGLIAVAGRLAIEDPLGMDACFANRSRPLNPTFTAQPAL